MLTIKTFNNIAQAGLDQFPKNTFNVCDNESTPDAILLRSFTLHDVEIPHSVKIIARAGAGTNNIPIDKMTALGIPVLNTPGANANAVKELVITGMLLACRNICPAWDYTRGLEADDAELNVHVEKGKKQFSGFELPGKTLGVIGLGSIGVKVANAAIDLGMNVIGYDPAMTVKNAWKLNSNVQQADNLDQALKNVDFMSIHVPLIEPTKHLINTKRFKQMKKGVILLNFSREGIIDNDALLKAIADDHVRTYVCDFPSNAFKDNPRIICLPHLGASTKEAEENCAVMAAQQIKAYLQDGHIQHSVNFPAVKMPRTEGFRLSVVNANVPNMVAQISTVLSEASINIIDMINKSRDDIAYTLLDVNEKPSDSVMENLANIEGVIRARNLD